MPTAEEEAAAKAAADAARSKAEGDRLADLEAKLEAEKKSRQDLELRMAKEKVLANFSNVKDFEDMIQGKTPDEIFNSAKALSDKIAARDAAALKLKEEELQKKWGNLPGGSPISPALTQSRMDEYNEAKKIPDFKNRVATLFRMKVDDMHVRMRNMFQSLARG